jgi:hypothetical protein
VRTRLPLDLDTPGLTQEAKTFRLIKVLPKPDGNILKIQNPDSSSDC